MNVIVAAVMIATPLTPVVVGRVIVVVPRKTPTNNATVVPMISPPTGTPVMCKRPLAMAIEQKTIMDVVVGCVFRSNLLYSFRVF